MSEVGGSLRGIEIFNTETNPTTSLSVPSFALLFPDIVTFSFDAAVRFLSHAGRFLPRLPCRSQTATERRCHGEQWTSRQEAKALRLLWTK
jgi:hypothetical protein